MKHVILDNRIPKDALSALTSLGYSPIFLPCFSSLDAPVSAHPDMLLFFGDSIFCPKNYYFKAKEALDKISEISGLGLTLSDDVLSSKYPYDIKYNALKLGSFLFGRLQNISEDIISYAKRSNLTLVNVNQGYTKCSVCKVSDNAIITSDASIKNAAQACGIDVLEINPGQISLNGYGYGFIGGASGSDGDRVFFCGSLDLHPDGDAIRAFCKKHKKEAVSLSDEPLYDIGTMFFI